MAFFFGVNKEVLPLKINLAFQEARLKSANNDLHRAQNTLVQKEEELSHVKQLYCAAVKEKQKLTNEAEICRRKMSAASTLINGGRTRQNFLIHKKHALSQTVSCLCL